MVHSDFVFCNNSDHLNFTTVCTYSTCGYIETFVTRQVQISFVLFRNVLGTKNLGDILSERESIAQDMQISLDEATDPWGVKVERVEV